MAATTDFIAAIELGSSKITGIAGKKLLDGSIQVLAMASENSEECIRKGVIYNLDKTAQSLTSIIHKMESALKASIGKVYVGISGQSLRTLLSTQTLHFDEETKITQELVDILLEKNRQVPIVDQEILEVSPQEYKVGNNLLIDPVGVPTDSIEGRFLNIIARSSVRQNIEKCFNQAGIEIVDYIISPLALADAVLTSTERRSGCALIDFGADTTTVSVYKNNILRHMVVIPLGGNNITKDICSKQIEEEDAEALKVRYGNAWAELTTEEKDPVTYTIGGRCSINADELNDIVEARISEILQNVWNQVMISDYQDNLLAGAVLTGGSSNLTNIDIAFSKITHINKVRIAKETQFSVKGTPEVHKDGTQNTIIALLAEGKENCCETSVKPQKKEEQTIPPAVEGLFNEKGESAEKERQQKIDELNEKIKKENELKQLQAEYLSIMNEVHLLKEQQNYKEALNELNNAKNLGLPDKEEEIKDKEKEIKELKRKNSRWNKWLNVILEDDKNDERK